MIIRKEGHLDIYFETNKYTDEEKNKIINNVHEKEFSFIQSKLKEFIHTWEEASHNKYSYIVCNPIIKATIIDDEFLKLELSSTTGTTAQVHMKVKKILKLSELI